MSRSLTGLAVVAGLALMAPPVRADAAADAGGKASAVESPAQKSRGAGPDENVKKDTLDKNAPGNAGKLAPEKGGEKSRQQVCRFHVDNRTNLIIHQILVDGDIVGSVSPGGDAYGRIECGSHNVYARAFFDDGSASTWGPRGIYCSVSAAECTWTLRP